MFNDNGNISTSTFVLLTRHFKEKPMFPSLTSLTLRRSNDLHTLPLFLSPTLKSISCLGSQSSPGLHSGHLKMMLREVPFIKRLELDMFLSYPHRMDLMANSNGTLSPVIISRDDLLKQNGVHSSV